MTSEIGARREIAQIEYGDRESPSRARQWPALALSIGVTLLVVGPTLFIAEDWHGYPLIDHHGDGWIIAMVIALGGYLAGGMVVGVTSPSTRSAITSSGLLVVGTLLVLVPGDLVRRATHAKNFITLTVFGLWCEAAAAAIALTAIAAIGMVALGARSPRSGASSSQYQEEPGKAER